MNSEIIQTPMFKVACEAKQVFLVDHHESGRSRVVHLVQVLPSKWQTKMTLEPGLHRLRFYCGDDLAVLYFGPAMRPGATIEELDAVLHVRPPMNCGKLSPLNELAITPN